MLLLTIKQTISLVLISVILSGCGGYHSVQDCRLRQPRGDFSYVTPEGWKRTKPIGIEFIIVATEPDHGTRPNFFVNFVAADISLDEAVTRLNEASQQNHRSYEFLSQHDFVTDSGLTGIKIAARRQSKDQRLLVTYQYVIADADRVFAITCTCDESVKGQYEPVFDAAMRTLESENKK